MITIFAPDGIGEVTQASDIAEEITRAVASHPAGPLRAGDIVVVTSKIISKAEGRLAPAGDREAAIAAESTHTLAWRGPLRIARTRTGQVQAAAGVDTSNAPPDVVLLLPVDPDASAARVRAALLERVDGPVGVLVSDTAGRAWRLGQTDHAIGAAGVRVLRSYVGANDPYGNPLQVSITALGDELAAAADLAKGKLAGRPVAVVRGLSGLVTDAAEAAATRAESIVRPEAEDMFSLGTREAVLAAVLAATGRPDAYRSLVGLDGEELIEAALAGCGPGERDFAERLLRASAPASFPPPAHSPAD